MDRILLYTIRSVRILKLLDSIRFDPIGALVKDREIKIRTTVTDGIDHVAEGFEGLLQGENFGKAVLTIADLELLASI